VEFYKLKDGKIANIKGGERYAKTERGYIFEAD
jgi:hypothetical protein